MAVEEFADVIPGQRDLEGGEVEAGQQAYTPPLDEIEVRGTSQLGLFEEGSIGKQPTSATVTLAGGKVGLVHGTAFRKGETVQFLVTATVTAIKLQDKTDSKTGIVMSCEQQHTARITDVRVA